MSKKSKELRLIRTVMGCLEKLQIGRDFAVIELRAKITAIKKNPIKREKYYATVRISKAGNGDNDTNTSW